MAAFAAEIDSKKRGHIRNTDLNSPPGSFGKTATQEELADALRESGAGSTWSPPEQWCGLHLFARSFVAGHSSLDAGERVEASSAACRHVQVQRLHGTAKPLYMPTTLRSWSKKGVS